MYRTRAEKAAFIAQKFNAELGNTILDVGAGQALLRHLTGDKNYIAVDFESPSIDIAVNLEQASLPFASNSFDTVICTDVLEHVDHAHELFDELVRVSRQNIIISLPNPFGAFSRRVLKMILFKQDTKPNSSDPNAEKYAFPPDKPLDRHKWFFNYSDAKRFIEGRSQLNQCEVSRLFPVYAEKRQFLEPIRRLAYGRFYDDLNAHALWAIIKTTKQE